MLTTTMTAIILMTLLTPVPPLPPPIQGEPAVRVCRDADATWTYDVYNVQGWKVLIEQSVASDKRLTQDLLRILTTRLASLISVVPPQRHQFLRSIPIWVSDEPTYPLRPNEKGVIPFHRSARWLRNHGLNPEMAPGVHVINPRPVLYEHKVFQWAPETMLHELAHAYHNLQLGLDHPDVRSAYEHAMATGLYQQIPSRSDPAVLTQAYAATNHEEYFSELTEAWFGHNDWFPHNRAELKQYDPVGHNMIQKVWHAPDRKQVPSPHA